MTLSQLFRYGLIGIIIAQIAIRGFRDETNRCHSFTSVMTSNSDSLVSKNYLNHSCNNILTVWFYLKQSIVVKEKEENKYRVRYGLHSCCVITLYFISDV